MINDFFLVDELGPYYMAFREKANYDDCLDEFGVPRLNYHGAIGLQYNPIAISQYGLGNLNLYLATKQKDAQSKFLLTADWLADNLVENELGVPVWMHNFDFEYREVLKSPWYSGLAQGQGISVLVRAFQETQRKKYLQSAEKAYRALTLELDEGGVIFSDQNGNIWIEEYIQNPPTHILNGFIWALWGVYDYYLATGSKNAQDLFEKSVNTLIENLPCYDAGNWSLYDLPGLNHKNFASHFYHQLHIVQLRVMYRMSGEEIFQIYADKWQVYQNKRLYRTTAFIKKALFKLRYY